MASLKRIKIEGFKSIKEMDIELRPINIMIGANGAGKSNFISLFRMLKAIAEGRFQKYVAQSGRTEGLLYYGRKVTDEIYIELPFEKAMYYSRLTPTADDSLMINEGLAFYNKYSSNRKRIIDLKDKDLLSISLSTGSNESIISHATKNKKYYDEKNFDEVFDAEEKKVVEFFEKLLVYHFQDTSETSKIKTVSNIKDNVSLRHDGSNIAAYLYWMKNNEPSYYDVIVKTIRLVAPFFGDFDLKPDRDNPSQIMLEWQEKDSDKYFNASMLSDGTLRFMCLATLLLQPQKNMPSIIIIDEPELGLHPSAINVLAGMLKSVSSKRQVIVSTQSVTFIDQFSPKDIIVVDREGEKSVFKRLSTKELENWLDKYSLGELWEKNIFGGRP